MRPSPKPGQVAVAELHEHVLLHRLRAVGGAKDVPQGQIDGPQFQLHEAVLSGPFQK